MQERRKHVLSEEDINLIKERVISDIIQTILEEENIDKFAEKFEERWRNYFYRGLGKGVWSWAKRGIILAVFSFAAYGMGKGWKLW